MDEDPSTAYRLERSPEDWVKAANPRLIGRYDEAKAIVKQFSGADVPAAYEDEDEDSANTSIPDVNSYRKDKYRFPEFGSRRMIPTGFEQSRLAEKYPEVSDLDSAIAKLSSLAEEERSGPLKDAAIEPLPPAEVFELCAIIAEAFIERHSEISVERAIRSLGLGLPPKVIDELAAKISTNKGEAKVDEKMRDTLGRYEWVDTSQVDKAIAWAFKAKANRSFLFSLAKGENSRDLMKLTSMYHRPPGVILKKDNGYKLLRYRDVYGQDPACTATLS